VLLLSLLLQLQLEAGNFLCYFLILLELFRECRLFESQGFICHQKLVHAFLRFFKLTFDLEVELAVALPQVSDGLLLGFIKLLVSVMF